MIDFHFINIEIPDFNSEFFVLSITKLIENESKKLGNIMIIFVADDYLLEMNNKYLKHDYYTDIITFDYCDNNVSGDLFISLDRVRENAKDFNMEFTNELHRVIIHGVLHLCGYNDKSVEEQELMRKMENKYLQ